MSKLPMYLILAKEKSAIWSVHPAFEVDEVEDAVRAAEEATGASEFPLYEWSERNWAWIPESDAVKDAEEYQVVVWPMFLILVKKRRAVPISIYPVFKQSEIDPTVDRLHEMGPGGTVIYHIYEWIPVRRAWIPSELTPGDIR